MSRSRRVINLGRAGAGEARAQMREELEFHLEARVAQLIRAGMDPESARAEALRRMGGALEDAEEKLGPSAEHKEVVLAMLDRFADLKDDARFALRGLVRRPAFAITAIVTLALGIGANTAIYSAVDALLLRTLPFERPDRLMDVVQSTPDEGNAPWSYPKYEFFRDAQNSFSSLALYRSGQATITGNEPERVEIEEITRGYLSTLGIRLEMGTYFPPEVDQAPGARKMAFISDALWQRRFNADPHVIGQVLSINNEPWEIAGVLPPRFHGLSGKADALINLTARNSPELLQAWSLEFSLIGRMASGVSAEQATSEARAIGPRMYEALPMPEGALVTSDNPRGWSADARPLNTIRVAAGLRRSLLVLFCAVGLLLLVTCVNIANLLLARAVARRQEIAVRVAIGASRARLVRLMVTESIVLAIAGGVASLGVAWIGARILSTLNPQDSLRIQGLNGGIGAVDFQSISLDSSALIFTFAVTLLVGMVFGLVPAIRASRIDLTRDLKDGSSGSVGGARRVGTGRRALVTAEVALALTLLTASGLMIKSLGNLLSVDPGFDPRGVLTLRLSVPPGNIAPDSFPGFYDRLQEEIAALPGVERVALADCPPLNNGCNGTIMTFADRPMSATGNAMVGVHWVSPDWFATMGVPINRGRGFTTADRLGAPKVVVINQAAAREYFPGEDPIGKRVGVWQGGFDTGAEIVGIVGDVKYGTVDSLAKPDAYISYGQARIPRMMIFVRTAGDPTSIAAGVRAAVRRVAPMAPVYDMQPMASRVAVASSQARFSAILLGLFAAVALSLAAMGIYGVMSFAVAQRNREIGLRMALGASGGRVLSLVMREAAMMALAGLAIGLVGALAFTRLLRGMLFETPTTDAATYAAMIVVLGGSALIASWIPARRAARVDPMIALRQG